MLRQLPKLISSSLKHQLQWLPIASFSTSGPGIQRFQGKVAIVTASTEGIGYAIAERLAAEGAKVVVSSRKAANVEKAVETLRGKQLEVSGCVCHVGKPSDREKLVAETVQQHGGLDILVSNAAVNPYFGPLLQCPPEAWDKIFEINVKVPLELTKLVVPHMNKRQGGAIVYVSSIAGYQPSKALGAYAVSKTALLGLTKNMASELAEDNIRVNGLAPGFIITNFSSAIHTSEDLSKEVIREIPMRRMGQPSEMAGVAAFLCSDDASYVTGENYVAAGGLLSRL